MSEQKLPFPQEYLKTMRWSGLAKPEEIVLVNANLNAFWAWLQENYYGDISAELYRQEQKNASQRALIEQLVEALREIESFPSDGKWHDTAVFRMAGIATSALASAKAQGYGGKEEG